MNKAAISLESVSKIYKEGPGAVKAVDSVTFDIAEGELTLITGPSGSGKSTLLYLMAGMLMPTQGEVIVVGKGLNELSEGEMSRFRKKTIGFVFQAYNLIPSLTALENVIASRMFDSEKRYEKGEKLLESIGLGDRKEHLPSELSGGEQQRIAIARALLNDPEIIFADEPTGNLDTKAGENIVRILKGMNKKGKTVIIATHDPLILDGAESKRLNILDGKILQKKE